MSSYNGKLLELLSINDEPGNTSITVKLTLGQDIILDWKIDDVTAERLKALTSVSENYKYRISFHHVWVDEKQQFYSFLTKTFCEHTEKISFLCTEEFVNHLQVLKTFSDIDDLKDYPSFSIILPKKALDLNEQKPKRHHPRVSRLFVAILSTLTILLMGFSSHLYLNETAFAKKETATPKNYPITNNVIKKPKKVININTKKTESQNKEHHIPSVELPNPVSYSISDGSVALTFDDGPSKYTKAIVDVLAKYQAGGTFFFIGYNVKKYPEYVQYVNSKGLTIGNHSMHHPVFPNLPYKQQVSELTETNKLIEQITAKPVLLFRPPYEAKNDSTMDLIQQYHMKMVLWNRDTADWKTNNPTDILNYVKHTESSGAIILLHESQAVLNALPQIIEYLQSRNLKIVNLGD